MQRIVLGSVILFITVFISMPISAADTPSDAEVNLRQSLDNMGLQNAMLDMNVRISIPEQTRLNNLQQTEVMPAVDLWGTLVRPGDLPGDARRPTILISTAYRREFCILMGVSLVKHGYNVLAIDGRGTGSAGGGWTAFGPVEHYDMAFVIDHWIPLQPWSDGKVGMFGASYMAIIQFLAAGLVDCDETTGEPIHLKALFPMLPTSDPYRVIAAQGGLYDREFMSFWLFITDFLSILPPVVYGGEPTLAEWQDALTIWTAHILNIGESISWVMDPEHMNYCDYFKQKPAALYFPIKPKKGWRYDNGTPIEEGKRILPAKLPMFVVGGWFDIFTLGESECYQYGLAEQAPGDKTFVVGPWYHITGAMGLGLKSFANQEIAGRWFDWKIKGNEDAFMHDFPVLLYVMGEDRWRAEKDWPLPESRRASKAFFLSKLRPSKVAGDWFSDLNVNNNYALVESASAFDYSNPANPVLRHNPPILHGSNSRSNARWMMGGSDVTYDTSLYQEGIDKDTDSPYEDERSDELGVLTFSTEPLPTNVEVIGPLTLTFWARTKFTCPLSQKVIDQTVAAIKAAIHISDGNMLLDQLNKRDVQWIVELNDVLTDGRAKNITSGWLAASHRPYDPQNPTETDSDYTPFDPFYYADTFDAASHPDFNLIKEDNLYRYVVELWPTCNVFKAGHRIRVSLSGSDFPHILPTLIPSENTIVLDQEHQARLDFTTTTPGNEGTTWKWITPSKGTILEEFAAADAYMLTGKDSIESPATLEDDSTTNTTQNSNSSSSGGSSSGGCFITNALL